MIVLVVTIYLSIFLFIWYTSKLLYYKNKLVDGYWHIPQIMFLFVVYSLPFFLTYDYKYLLLIGAIGLQFPFLFNVGLNIYRKLPITYLGKYDFLTFKQTTVLFLIGILLIIIQIIWR